MVEREKTNDRTRISEDLGILLMHKCINVLKHPTVPQTYSNENVPELIKLVVAAGLLILAFAKDGNSGFLLLVQLHMPWK